MKLRIKVFLTNLVVTLLVFIILGAIIVNYVDDYNINGVYQQLVSQSYFAQSYVDQYLDNIDNPQLFIRENRNELELLLSIQAGCPAIIVFEDSLSLRPEQRAALSGNIAYYVDTKGEESIFYLAFPIGHDQEIIASVQYRKSLGEEVKMKKKLRIIFLSTFFIIVLVILVISYGFSYHLISPIEKLRDSIVAFSKGDFKELKDIKSGDEIQELTHHFNEMGQSIQNYIDRLLEEQIKQKRFLDSVTHEIRTPLTNMIGYTDLINRVDDPQTRKRYGEYVDREGQRLLKMVDDLLNLSKVRQYENTLNKEKTDLKELIEDVLKLMELRIKRGGITIIKNLSNVSIDVDKDKIKQVLINLVDNALKYSSGDRIVVQLFVDEFVKIIVKDNGVGINQKDLDQIFDPFFRVDQSRSRKLGGVGLGLSICKEIVEKHGGHIQIQSTKGQGTTVTISIHP